MELQLIDLYLARVNSQMSNKYIVTVRKKELETIMGVKYIRVPELEKKLTALQGKVFDISSVTQTEYRKRGETVYFDNILMFERAACVKDANGELKVILECTKSARNFIFNIEDLNYITYKASRTMRIKSIYTYRFFNYIEKNRYDKEKKEKRSVWTVSIEELKKELGCDKNNKTPDKKDKENKLYEDYNMFNRAILKKVKKELAEKAGYHIDYSPIREGRNIKYLRIKILSIDDVKEIIELSDLITGEKEDPNILEAEKEEETGEYEKWRVKGDPNNPDMWKYTWVTLT